MKSGSGGIEWRDDNLPLYDVRSSRTMAFGGTKWWSAQLPRIPGLFSAALDSHAFAFAVLFCVPTFAQSQLHRRRSKASTSSGTMTTLYDLLGALPGDDADDLRDAFRRAVKDVHPDIRPNDPDAALNFRLIVYAMEVLR